MTMGNLGQGDRKEKVVDGNPAWGGRMKRKERQG
jgi:hypothetical protein